jgi:citrate synthase
MNKRTAKSIPWTSTITHNVDQQDIIRDFSYEEMIYFLIMGKKPDKVQSNMLRAVIVSHISHGITGQSTMAVIQAADCRSSFLHAVIGGFSVGAGIYHQGGLQAAMLELQQLAQMSEDDLTKHVLNRLKKRDKIIGFGHRFHTQDPRAQTLLEIAEKEHFSGQYLRTARRVEAILYEQKGISMNIEAAGGSILLDLGFDPLIAHLVIIVGRSPMYAAAYLERLAQKRAPFQRLAVADIIEDKEQSEEGVIDD